MTKTCTKCGKEKPLDEYHKSKSNKYGRNSRCKECRRAHNEANREKISERERVYYEANREKIEKRRRAYRHENRNYLSRDTSQRIKQMNDLTHLTATRSGQPWEQWEDDFIANHPEMTAYQIANHIGRTYHSVAPRRRRHQAAASD